MYGSYPLLQYHENYYREPFTIQGALRKLPVEVKEAKEEPERLIASLKRGNMAAVMAIIGGDDQRGFLSINAKGGRLELRSANLELMDLRKLSWESGESGDIKS